MIAVVISANAEWEVVTRFYQVTEFKSTPFGDWFEVQMNNVVIGFFFGGWGKIDAAASTQHIIDIFSPELIVNLGTCGGFHGHAQAMDILLVERTIVYDIYELMFNADQAIRAYSTDIDLEWLEIGEDEPIIRGTLLSADKDLDPDEVEELRQRYQAAAGDWESGAIAHICKRNKTPILIARGVSDIVGSHGGEAYQSPELFISRTESIMQDLLERLPAWVAAFYASAKHK